MVGAMSLGQEFSLYEKNVTRNQFKNAEKKVQRKSAEKVPRVRSSFEKTYRKYQTLKEYVMKPKGIEAK